jgi:hypothetical protein
MPVWVRRFTMNKLQEFYHNQSEQRSQSQQQQQQKPNPVSKPNIKPTYQTRAPKSK